MDIKQEYDKLLASGMFWEFYPELSGEWVKDQEEFTRKLTSTRKALYTPIAQKQWEMKPEMYTPLIGQCPNCKNALGACTCYKTTSAPTRIIDPIEYAHKKAAQDLYIPKGMRDQKPDMVQEPPHYRQGRTEVFEQMLKLFGKEAVMNYCEINAFKYRMRAGYKGNVQEDISKAKWYEEKLKELMDETKD